MATSHQIEDRIDNPLANRAEIATISTSLVQVEQQRAIAEVQARMIIARANPRDPIRAVDQILQDCTRPTLANQALYQYSRGGTDITGPSIRLAEAMAQRWGNIASGIKEVGRRDGYSECVAYAWDLETGYYDERQFQVRHWRDTRSGGHALKDERDIYELVANMGQRRKRAALLTVIPGDVIEAAVSQCERTLEANADTSPEAMKRLLEAFEGFRVSREQIEKRCQRHLDAIRPAQIVLLRKIYASLKDGMSEPRDWFEMPPAPPRPRREDFVKTQEPLPTFVVINEQGEEEEFAAAPDAVERVIVMMNEYARSDWRGGLDVCFDNNDRLITDLNDAGEVHLAREIEAHYRALVDELRATAQSAPQGAGGVDRPPGPPHAPPASHEHRDRELWTASGGRRKPVADAAERIPERATVDDPRPKPPEAGDADDAVDGAGSRSEAAPAERGGGTATSQPCTPGDTGKAGRAGEAGGSPATDIVTELGRKLTAAALRGEKALNQAWLRLSEQERDLARPLRPHYREIAAKSVS